MAVRRNKKMMKNIIISGGLAALLTSGVWFMSSRYYNAKLIDERFAYEQQLAEQNEVLDRYRDPSNKAFILATMKYAGEVIEEDDFIEDFLPGFATPSNLIVKKEDIIGKHLKIDAEYGTAVTSEMVRDAAELDPSERKEETQYIKLPLKAKKHDVVDIRIVFPNGEDYIIVAKKRLEEIDLNKQYAFFNDTEEEAVMLQAALVDAYINDAELYMKQYVEPELQPKPTATYIPNIDVIQLIRTNPMIVDQAKWDLTESIRVALEKRLALIKPDDRFRIGANAPIGSGVTSRIVQEGAVEAQVDDSQSVKGIVERVETGNGQTESFENGSSIDPSVGKPNLDDQTSTGIDSDVLGGQ
ncbi:hypothetical protein [Paenibacillus sp. KS-LC4]|uniref:hypothetical protein n=1 Tax=Paenibacillus sp. KS-LC4 TaxID=2979727 RepID=UPI0030D4B903